MRHNDLNPNWVRFKRLTLYVFLVSVLSLTLGSIFGTVGV